MKCTVASLATLMLLASMGTRSQMLQPTVVDFSTFTYEKGINYQAAVKQGEYEVGQFEIEFSPVVSEGQHDQMFKDIKDNLYQYVCSSCQPVKINSEDIEDGILCHGLVYRCRTYGAPSSMTYGITISFPLQEKENLKKIKKEIDNMLKELLSIKQPKVHYSISYSKTKQKVKSKMK